MKSNKKEEFLAELRRIPIVQVACEKVGLSRNTIYRWRKEDKEFSQVMVDALAEGEDLVNDMGESQLLAMIKDKNWAAISFWLRHRNPKFRERLEVTANIQSPQEELTAEQQEVVARALELARQGLIPAEQKVITPELKPLPEKPTETVQVEQPASNEPKQN
jgi:DNA-binding XRE family transcriptional regulator